jgi:hypothetical protein
MQTPRKTPYQAPDLFQRQIKNFHSLPKIFQRYQDIKVTPMDVTFKLLDAPPTQQQQQNFYAQQQQQQVRRNFLGKF